MAGGGRAIRRVVLVGTLIVCVVAPAARASQLVEIEVTSRFVDIREEPGGYGSEQA